MIGPIADSARDLHGRLRPPAAHRDAGELRHRANPFGFPSSDVIQPDRRAGQLADDPRRAPGPVRGIADHARAGHGPARRDRRGIAEAVAAARDAEVAIVVLGERSGLTDDATTGEFARPARPRASSAASRSCSRRSSRPARRPCSSSSAAGRWRSSGRPTTARRSSLAWVPGEAGPGGDRGGPRRRRRPGRPAADHGAAPRRPGPADLPPPPDRRPVELEGRLRRRAGRAALAVRVRAVVHVVRDRPPAGRPERRSRRPATRRSIRVDVTNTGARRRRRGRPALRPRRGGDGRPAGHRAARVPARPARARRVPDRHLPAVDRAARLRRRRLPAGRRAGPRPPVRRPLVGRPAAVGDRSRSSARRSSSSSGTGTSPRPRTRPRPDDRAGVGGVSSPPTPVGSPRRRLT